MYLLQNLLIYRWLLLQLAYAAALAIGWQAGVLQYLYLLDASGVVLAINAVFIFAWFDILRHIGRVTKELNYVKKTGDIRPCKPAAMEKAIAKIAYINQYPLICVELGLFGTILGVVIALYSPDWSSVNSAADLSKVIGPLLMGMGTAFMTTLAGMIAGRMLQNNITTLQTAHATLWADRVLEGS